jgi:hypothetical protein
MMPCNTTNPSDCGQRGWGRVLPSRRVTLKNKPT